MDMWGVSETLVYACCFLVDLSRFDAVNESCMFFVTYSSMLICFFASYLLFFCHVCVSFSLCTERVVSLCRCGHQSWIFGCQEYGEPVGYFGEWDRRHPLVGMC